MAPILSIRVIRRKIRSVGNIKKITRAMQMVSAAKLKKVQERLLQLRPYADKIRDFLEGLSTQVKDLDYPLFRPRKTVRKIGAVVMMADKGLCGSYNANMARYIARFRAERGTEMQVMTVGKKADDYFRRTGPAPRDVHSQLPTEVPFSEIKGMTRTLVDWYLKEEVDEVYLLFTRYVNAMTFQPGHVRFLPIEPERREKALSYHYELEPGAKEILEHLLPRYIEITFHRLLLESFSSEHAARMNAMRNATENATELIDQLTLTYNKARQAGITKELLDIVGGAEALRG